MDTYKKTLLLIIALLLFVSGCLGFHREKLQGYIEGRFNYLAVNYSGALSKLFVRRGDVVKAGQLLAVLDPEPQKSALDAANDNLKQAQAQIDQYKANLILTELTLTRNQELRKKGAVSQEAVDIAQANRDAAFAQLQAATANFAAARATAAEAKWSYTQKVIVAPLDGKVFDNYYEVGDWVPAEHAIYGLLAPQNVYLVFFLPEVLLSKIKIGDTVEFTCDSCKKTFSAAINFISPNTEYTPPVIYSRDTRQNLVYRVEAALAREDAVLLHPGQPVDIVIYTQRS
jgi:HlyD family secretion protein